MYGKEGIEYLESAYADLLFSDYTVDEEAKTITPKKGIEFKSRQAIVCFELEDTNGNTITDGKSGISCIGNVTLNLKGTNKVKGLNEDYPGIWIKENFTLEIKGDGSLEASSDNGAGIGCASYTVDTEKDCGNILITSGNITASSGVAAGIGAGHTSNDSSCGDIIIDKDAVVTAMGGDEAAAIGTAGGSSSGYSYCNSITIKSGATVTVTKSNNTEEAIGKGNGGSMRKENPVTIEEGANVTINGAE